MEHEVYVPFSVDSVRAALSDQERVARCVPGLQQAAAERDSDDRAAGQTGEARITGRLRLRLGGSTITYRGWLSVLSQDEGFTAEGSGTEARGSGTVRLTLTAVPRPSDEGEGTVLACLGGVDADGRIAEYDEKTVASAGRRLLDRFGAALADSLSSDPPPLGAVTPGGIGEPDDNERVIPGIPSPEVEEPPASALGEPDGATGDDAPNGEEGGGRAGEPGRSETGGGAAASGRAGNGPEARQTPGADAATDGEAAASGSGGVTGSGGAAHSGEVGRKSGSGRTGPSRAAGGGAGGAGAAEGTGSEAGTSEGLGGAGAAGGPFESDGSEGAGAAEGEGVPGSEPRSGGDPEAERGPEGARPREETSGSSEPEQEPTGIFDTEIPPPSLDPLEETRGEGADDDGPVTAEAAHARRTMIGRSAEEVDHAPPRGRYAPVPVPEPPTATATLRWAAPAAAVVVAGAIVLGRALRRRR